MPAMTLHIDFETRSAIDLRVVGPWVYAMDPSTDLWCVCWAIDDGPVKTWLPADAMPQEIAEYVTGGGALVAHNALGFERIIWKYILGPRYGWPEPKLEQWYCTAAMAATMSLPRALKNVAPAIGLDIVKADNRLMLQMARPRRTENNGTIIWWDDPDKLKQLIEYCEQDVEVERAVFHKLRPLSDKERQVFLLDGIINERGIQVDLALVDRASEVVSFEQARLDAMMSEATNGAVNSAAQVKEITAWCQNRGLKANKIDKFSIAKALKEEDLDDNVRRVLQIRAEAAKSSTAKLAALKLRTCSDGRIRDNIMYHGAATGRFSGKGFQPQNVPRPTPGADVDALIDTFMGDLNFTSYEQTPLQCVSDILRGTLISKPGHDLIACDFAQIEARVLAWLAGQTDLVGQFRDGKDVYKLMASTIYKKSIDEVVAYERFLGKTVILGAGYGLGHKKFRSTLARQDNVDLTEEEAKHIINTYRTTNSAIKRFWRNLEDQAIAAVQNPGRITYAANRRVRFRYVPEKWDVLWMILPSGRPLAYYQPEVSEEETPWNTMKEGVTYVGINTYTRAWERNRTYGGRLVENATQAIARDIMADSMLRLEAFGYPIILTVHDEIVCEVPEGFGSVEEMETLMSDVPAWASGCPIAAEGWRGKRYQK
jgi:DNA polymerase